MPKKKSEKHQSVEDLRHAEYYDLQPVFDELYSKSKDGQTFDN